MAYIEKRSGSYLVRWRENGRLLSESFKRKSDALDFKAELEAARRRGSYVPRHLREVPVEEYAVRVLEVQELSKRAMENYRSTLRNHVEGTPLGRTGIGLVGPDDVRRHFAAMMASGASASVRFGTRKVLSKTFRAALADGLLVANPIVGVPTPKVDTVHAEPMTPEEVEAMATAIDPRYRALVLLLAYSGLRPGEAAALRADDIDVDHRTVYVSRKLKTRSSRRGVVIPESILAELIAHIDRFGLADDGRVFATSRGGVVGRETLGRAWRKALAATGISRRRVYDLRHTHASWLLGHDVSAALPTAQARMGHSTSRMLLEVYAHRLRGADDVVADALERLRRAPARED